MSGSPIVPKTIEGVNKAIIAAHKRLIELHQTLVRMVDETPRSKRKTLAAAKSAATEGDSVRARVLEHFNEREGEEITVAALTKALGCSPTAARVYVHEYEKSHMLIRVKHGVYRAVTEKDEEVLR